MGSLRTRVVPIVLGVILLAAAGAGGAARDMGGTVSAARPRTIAVVPHRISRLVADGPRLAWWISDRCELKIQVFNRATRRLTTIRPNLNCEVPRILGTALAGTRVVWGAGGPGLDDLHAWVDTATVADRRPRALVDEFSVDNYPEGDLFGYPVRIAGGGGRLAILAFGDLTNWNVLRVVGPKAVRVPYQPRPLAGFAVEGRRFATANWARPLGRDWLPAWSPDGTEIAWNHDGAIWLMRADGSGENSLSAEGTAAPGTGPVWSPDGKTLAFESSGGIFLIGDDGSKLRPLTAGSRPSWSPDGTTLAFIRSEDLWVIGADGSGGRQLTSSAGCDSRPDWSPDGKSLVLACVGRIRLVEFPSGTERDLSPAGLVASDPAWSPGGDVIAFAAYDQKEFVAHIWAVRPDGGGLRTLASGYGQPAWSPDGRRLVFSRDIGDQGYQQIRIMNADGSNQQALKNANLRSDAPQWSPDGKTIIVGDTAVAPYLGASGVYALDPAGGKSRLLAAPTYPPMVELRDIVSGKLLREWQVPGVSAVWLSGNFLVAKSGTHCLRYELATGAKRGVSGCTGWIGLSLSGSRGVYRIGRRIYRLDLRSGRSTPLAVAGLNPAGPLIEGNGVFWAEPYRAGSRVRGIVLR